jgi:hypothetical protein
MADDLAWMADLRKEIEVRMAAYSSDVAAAMAHRACCGAEHDPQNGKLHGCCVVCGVPWPCDTAKHFLRGSPNETRTDPALLKAAAQVDQRHAELMEKALKDLVFAARTSGGVAGRDEGLCAACETAERVLNWETDVPQAPAPLDCAHPAFDDNGICACCKEFYDYAHDKGWGVNQPETSHAHRWAPTTDRLVDRCLDCDATRPSVHATGTKPVETSSELKDWKREVSRLRGIANVCLASKPTSGMMRHALEQIDGGSQ